MDDRKEKDDKNKNVRTRRKGVRSSFRKLLITLKTIFYHVPQKKLANLFVEVE